MRRYIVLLASLLIVFTACRKEAILTPSVDVPSYTLPQGNHSYDDSIVQFYQKYNCYILYRFTHTDFAYNYTNMRQDSAFNANPAYIGNTLRFFYDQLITRYPESFLKKTLPFKVLLASYIGTGATRDAAGFASTISTLTIGWADSTLPDKTPAATKQMRGLLNRFYMERAYRVKSVDIPQAFIELAPYDYLAIQPGNKYANGVIGNTNASILNVVVDFLDYVEAITSHSKAELEATVLSPTVDTKGLIRKKYEIIINYFANNFATDLQAVGEKP
ncbi:hypothetical protein SAMN04488128_104349 [Chitinophaga eiseniae]|uniref:Fasciclin domain-containing protein n=1 Tax=Chitinophaga eiseniae TaxID=634771 RepID=A0A1T4TBZ9_9BACT|nr:hypothetical protein [Chitinophaga eiseniae]SKA37851.1 hypothetical protein SAMN04488128_104349 [Chitinophaga eiseniae]